MSEQQGLFKWPVRIYYEDTDAGGVVYHANYLKYFERARTEQLRSAGISQFSLFEQDIAFVVRNIEIDYKLPARLDDELFVDSQIVEHGRASLLFCQNLVNLEGIILCQAYVKVVCVNPKKMKSTAIPKTILTEITRDR
ncbi:tol-pal system-associated acyl-CoA thioesterase [Vibrio sp. SS-MA-C1-2]|uniref:tol-pal system-associated acyl-CoA thioesterase n=1 Tax=Vibrio sp. SS-MA-C1-2 TaxID=2908646 RepID=UPI001F025511|nr:tol-pal system-associated acyl-CoA thioesterase [Vibrio sp. SS-MA-C1-2]UJF18624.1 tol-pal system-associated acyl-CoA thioesterase [Vibrio sp. SS-MA-C1-2]